MKVWDNPQEEVAAERIRLGRLSHALDPDVSWTTRRSGGNLQEKWRFQWEKMGKSPRNAGFNG